MYVDIDYYIANRKSSEPDAECTKDIQEVLDLAEMKVDEVTFNRIRGIGFDNLTEFQKDKVRKAVCVQADYIQEYGGYTDGEPQIESYSVLDISVSVSNKQTDAERAGMATLAYKLLEQTGLMRRAL